MGAARLNDFSSDEISERRLLMDSGRFLMIVGGWLELAWMYNGVLLGLVYSMCFPLVELRLTSRKSTDFLLASIVIFKPCVLKIAHRYFLINSTSRGDPSL